MDPQTQLYLIVAVVFVVLIVVAGPRIWRLATPRLGKMAGEAYQKRFLKQLRKKYPLLAERLDAYDMGPASQEAFQTAMHRLPPQEAMKLQAEFNRLRENFMLRHPEIAPMFSSAQDPREQAKLMDQVLKLPDDKRAAIEKDLIWAWDQLRGRFPKLVGPLENTLKKKPVQPAAPVAASK